jgi:hypothetical protein
MAARSGEHLRSYRRKDSDSLLWKYCQEEHGGYMEATDLLMVLVSHHGDPLDRLMSKGILIKGAQPGSFMNSR